MDKPPIEVTLRTKEHEVTIRPNAYRWQTSEQDGSDPFVWINTAEGRNIASPSLETVLRYFFFASSLKLANRPESREYLADVTETGLKVWDKESGQGLFEAPWSEILECLVHSRQEDKVPE